MQSLRYCRRCRRIKTFFLNKVVGHSECSECGSRFGIKKIPEIQSAIDKERNARLKEVDVWYQKERKKISKMLGGKNDR